MKRRAHSLSQFGFALGLLTAGVAAPSALHPQTQTRAQAAPPLAVFLALDFALPGYGAFYESEYLSGFAIASFRLASIALALEFQRQRSVYRSAASAARLADVYYGGPLRYRDPYGDGYRSAEEFARFADRRAAYARLGASLHLLTTAISLTRTYFLHERLSESNGPALDLRLGPGASAQDLRLEAQLQFSADAL